MTMIKQKLLLHTYTNADATKVYDAYSDSLHQPDTPPVVPHEKIILGVEYDNSGPLGFIGNRGGFFSTSEAGYSFGGWPWDNWKGPVSTHVYAGNVVHTSNEVFFINVNFVNLYKEVMKDHEGATGTLDLLDKEPLELTEDYKANARGISTRGFVDTNIAIIGNSATLDFQTSAGKSPLTLNVLSKPYVKQVKVGELQ